MDGGWDDFSGFKSGLMYRVGVCYMLSERDIMNGDIMITTSKKVQT